MEPPLHIRGLLIDMDGLLLDTERLSERCWRSAEQSTGFYMPDGFYHSLIGQSMAGIKQRLQDVMVPECDVPAFLRVAGEIYTAALHEESIPVKRHAREFLEYIANRSVPRCLATSTGRDLCRHKLDKAGLAEYLPERVCGDDVQHSKPAPDIYLAAADRLGIPPSDLLVIEDSENGLRSAMAAGCKTVHIPDIGAVCIGIQARVDRIYRDLNDLTGSFERGEIVVA